MMFVKSYGGVEIEDVNLLLVLIPANEDQHQDQHHLFGTGHGARNYNLDIFEKIGDETSNATFISC